MLTSFVRSRFPPPTPSLLALTLPLSLLRAVDAAAAGCAAWCVVDCAAAAVRAFLLGAPPPAPPAPSAPALPRAEGWFGEADGCAWAALS
jgi:hypothetical protein